MINSGLKVEAQKRIEVRYKNEIVGEYIADIIIEGSIILELVELKLRRNLENQISAMMKIL